MTWATSRAVLAVAIIAVLSAVDSSVGGNALRLPAFNDSSLSTFASVSTPAADHPETHTLSSPGRGKLGICSLGTWLRRLTSASASEGNGAGGWWLGWAWGADATVSIVDRAPPVSLAARPASFGRAIEDPVMGYGIPMNSFTIPCEDLDDGSEGESGSGSNWRRYANRGLGGRRVWALASTARENLGCPRLCPKGAHLPSPEEAWIAIVQRGKCSFVDKVREAQRFGAKAVIVGGDDPDVSGNPDVLVTMYSQMDASDVKIPSTFIKFTDYVRLTDLIAASNTSTSGIKTVSLQITADFASWEWYSPILTFLVLLLLPSLLTLATLFLHRLRSTRAEQRERAPEQVVSRLPWRVWTGSGWEKYSGPVPPDDVDVGTLLRIASTPESVADADADLERGDVQDNAAAAAAATAVAGPPPQSTEADDTESIHPPWFEGQTECAICLTDFCVGDRVRVLPCKHIFHLAEVDEWLIHRKKLCPICKADVTKPAPTYTRVDRLPTLTPTHTPIPRPSLLPSPTERTPLLAAPGS